jgi:hypothetical protein
MLLPGTAGVIAFVAAHLVAGAAIGARLRFMAVLPASVLVLGESLLGDFYFHFAAWYALLVAGVVAVQVGYAIASRFRPADKAARPPAELHSLHTLEPK